jgi:biopolymer transport protein ExbB
MAWMLLLQIPADTLPQIVQPAAQQVPEQLSLWYLLKEGGILMIPLALCSILAVYIFVERLLAIRKAGKAPNDFMSRIREKITEGSIPGAQSLCKNYEGSLPRGDQQRHQPYWQTYGSY